MISKLHNSIVSFVTDYFRKYGINCQAQYNSEIGLIKQYISSLNYRAMFKNIDVPGLTEEILDELQKKSYNLLLYKYSPLKSAERTNNIKQLELAFKKNLNSFTDFELSDKQDTDFYLFKEYIRNVQDVLEQDFDIRQAVFGEFEYEFTFLSTDTDVINNVQFIYVSNLQQINKLTISLDLGLSEPIEIDYLIQFNDINDVGHIDYERYGNLQQITFSATLQGLILSNYKYNEPQLNIIDIGLDVINKNETDDQFIQNGIEKFHN